MISLKAELVINREGRILSKKLQNDSALLWKELLGDQNNLYQILEDNWDLNGDLEKLRDNIQEDQERFLGILGYLKKSQDECQIGVMIVPLADGLRKISLFFIKESLEKLAV